MEQNIVDLESDTYSDIDWNEIFPTSIPSPTPSPPSSSSITCVLTSIFFIQYDSEDELRAGNYTLIIPAHEMPGRYQVQYTFHHHRVIRYHMEMDWGSGSPPDMLPQWSQPPDVDEPLWAPFGQHGFFSMFWVRYPAMPSNVLPQLEYRFKDTNHIMEKKLQLALFDYIHPPEDLEPSLRVWMQSPNRQAHCQVKPQTNVLFVNTIQTSMSRQDPHSAVWKLNEMNRIAIHQRPDDDLHTYSVIFSLALHNMWVRLFISFRDEKFVSGFVMYGFHNPLDFASVQKSLFTKLQTVYDMRDLPNTPLRFDVWGLEEQYPHLKKDIRLFAFGPIHKLDISTRRQEDIILSRFIPCQLSSIQDWVLTWEPYDQLFIVENYLTSYEKEHLLEQIKERGQMYDSYRRPLELLL